MSEMMDFIFNLCRICAFVALIMFDLGLVTVIYNSLFNKKQNRQLLPLLIGDFLVFMLCILICYKGHYEPISNTANWEYIVFFAVGTMMHFYMCKNGKNIEGSELNDRNQQK